MIDRIVFAGYAAGAVMLAVAVLAVLVHHWRRPTARPGRYRAR